MAGSDASLRYFVINAFTNSPVKGNPAVVVLLDQERDQKCLQAMAKKFDSLTCYLTEVTHFDLEVVSKVPTFKLRWFGPVAEFAICGHGTLASAHALLSSGMIQGDEVEFVTHSGNFLAKKIRLENHQNNNNNFLIQLSFPLHRTVQLHPSEIKLLPASLKTLPILNMFKVVATGRDDLIVELESSKDVVEFNPVKEDIEIWPGQSVSVTAIAPPSSGFDFFSRLFAPKLGYMEDHVCGSLHCALAPYWSNKLGKSDLKAYMASSRGGALKLHVEEETKTVFISGEAVTVMEGLIVA